MTVTFKPDFRFTRIILSHALNMLEQMASNMLVLEMVYAGLATTSANMEREMTKSATNCVGKTRPNVAAKTETVSSLSMDQEAGEFCNHFKTWLQQIIQRTLIKLIC